MEIEGHIHIGNTVGIETMGTEGNFIAVRPPRFNRRDIFRQIAP